MPLLRNQISLQDLGNGPKGIIPTDLEKTKSVGIFAVEILKNMVKIFNYEARSITNQLGNFIKNIACNIPKVRVI